MGWKRACHTLALQNKWNIYRNQTEICKCRQAVHKNKKRCFTGCKINISGIIYSSWLNHPSGEFAFISKGAKNTCKHLSGKRGMYLWFIQFIPTSNMHSASWNLLFLFISEYTMYCTPDSTVAKSPGLNTVKE